LAAFSGYPINYAALKSDSSFGMIAETQKLCNNYCFKNMCATGASHFRAGFRKIGRIIQKNITDQHFTKKLSLLTVSLWALYNIILT